MSNTVRRPRRRPRKTSVAWKTFWWLLRRTAAQASYEKLIGARAAPHVRDWFRTASAARLARYVATLHLAHPSTIQVRRFRG